MQVAVLDDQLGPNQTEQFLFRYQMARAFNQRHQYVERPWLYDRRHARCQQPALTGLQLKAPPPVVVEAGGFLHRWPAAGLYGEADAVYRVARASRRRPAAAFRKILAD